MAASTRTRRSTNSKWIVFSITGWVYVGHESEVAERGDFRTRDIGKQPVIMVRGDDDVVRVLMNRCTHRAAAVCPYERGNARLFSCAYHGWSFRNTGTLAAVPHPERYGDDFRKEDLGLRPAPRTESYRGLIFSSLTADVQSLSDYLGPLARAEIDLACDLSPVGELDVSAGIHKYGYRANWKLQLENAVDAYHLNYLHSSFFRRIKERNGVDLTKTATGVSASEIKSLGNGHVLWNHMTPGNAVNRSALSLLGNQMGDDQWRHDYMAALISAHGRERADMLATRSRAHMLIFPNVVLLANQIRRVNPKSVGETEVFLYPTLLKGAPPEINRNRLKEHEEFYGPAGGGATDDLEVFERVATGLRAEVDPWIRISRGLKQEFVGPDGAIVGQITDELGSRAFFQQWKSKMIDIGSDVGGEGVNG